MFVGEDGRGVGHFALALTEESKRVVWTSSLSAHKVHLQSEDVLYNWHQQPYSFLEFWLSPRYNQRPECGRLTLVLF